MFKRIAASVIVGVATFLACLFVAFILKPTGVPILVLIATFLEIWGIVIGVLAGGWYFLTGKTFL